MQILTKSGKKTLRDKNYTCFTELFTDLRPAKLTGTYFHTSSLVVKYFDIE